MEWRMYYRAVIFQGEDILVQERLKLGISLIEMRFGIGETE
jgi:hypothetical protein